MKNRFIFSLLCSFFLFSYIQSTVLSAAAFSSPAKYTYIKQIILRGPDSFDEFKEIHTHLFLNGVGIGPKISRVSLDFAVKGDLSIHTVTFTNEFLNQISAIFPDDFMLPIILAEANRLFEEKFEEKNQPLPKEYRIYKADIEMDSYQSDLYEFVQDLYRSWASIDEKMFWDIMHSICKQVTRMHEHGILHLDLKPENIFYNLDRNDSMQIMVGDFGTSRTPAAVGFLGGTPNYVTPEDMKENLNGTLKNLKPGIERDYWAIGLIAYYLLNQIHLFTFEEDKNFADLVYEIAFFKGLTDEQMQDWTEEQKIFVTNLLHPDFSKRQILFPEDQVGKTVVEISTDQTAVDMEIPEDQIAAEESVESLEGQTTAAVMDIPEEQVSQGSVVEKKKGFKSKILHFFKRKK